MILSFFVTDKEVFVTIAKMKYQLRYYVFMTVGWSYLLLSVVCCGYVYATKGPVFLYGLLMAPDALMYPLLMMRKHHFYSPRYVDKLSGEDFELWLKNYFRHKGFHHIKTTKKTRDYGADLIMKKWTYTYVVQAKRYDHNIGVFAIQQALAAKAYYKADKAIVVTNRYFTTSAVTLAKVNEVILYDRYSLFRIPQ